MTTARQIAADVLHRSRSREAFAAELIDDAVSSLSGGREPPVSSNNTGGSRPPLSAQDRRFLTQLVNGVIRRRGTLDALLKPFIRTPLHAVEPRVWDALHLGAFQVDDPADLTKVVAGVLLDLRPAQRGPGLVAARGVAHQGGVVADDDDGRMPQVLKLAELAQGDRVAEVDIDPGRVDAILDAQGDACRLGTFQFPDELLAGDDLLDPPVEDRNWNATPLLGVTQAKACFEPAAVVSRIITPALAQALVLVSEPTRAVMVKSPVRVTP